MHKLKSNLVVLVFFIYNKWNKLLYEFIFLNLYFFTHFYLYLGLWYCQMCSYWWLLDLPISPCVWWLDLFVTLLFYPIALQGEGDHDQNDNNLTGPVSEDPNIPIEENRERAGTTGSVETPSKPASQKSGSSLGKAWRVRVGCTYMILHELSFSINCYEMTLRKCY